MSNEVVKSDVVASVESQKAGLSAALADRIGVDRFVRAAVTSLRTSPKLALCTQESVLGGLFIAAQLGLEIGGPRAYAWLVPYGREAQLIVGVRGFVELFYRAGAKSARADIVREGDTVTRGTTADGHVLINWVDADPFNDTRKAVGAIATVVLASGEPLQEFMTRAQIMKRKPKASTSGPWSDWEDEMWKKTVLRQCAKTARLSSDDLALAIRADQTITTGRGDEAQVKHVPLGETEAPLDLTPPDLDPADPAYVDAAAV